MSARSMEPAGGERDRRAAPAASETAPEPRRRMQLRRAVQAVEQEVGDSLAGVRVVQAAGACAAMDARAYTTGDGAGGHVVGLAGDVDLESREGQFTLLHELAHVAQQRRGEAESLDGLEGDPGCRQTLEDAADATAAACLRGGE